MFTAVLWVQSAWYSKGKEQNRAVLLVSRAPDLYANMISSARDIEKHDMPPRWRPTFTKDYHNDRADSWRRGNELPLSDVSDGWLLVHTGFVRSFQVCKMPADFGSGKLQGRLPPTMFSSHCPARRCASMSSSAQRPVHLYVLNSPTLIVGPSKGSNGGTSSPQNSWMLLVGRVHVPQVLPTVRDLHLANLANDARTPELVHSTRSMGSIYTKFDRNI